MVWARSLIVASLALGGCATQNPPQGATPSEPGLKSLKSARGTTYAFVDDAAGPNEGAPRALAQPRAGQSRPGARATILSAALCPPKRNDGVTFDGCARAAAKTSFVAGPVQEFASIAALRRSLPADERMRSMTPPISSTAASNRVAEENRNVRVYAFLYAMKKEKDNDYHLILGDANCRSGDCFLTVEISALPRQRRYLSRLKAVRQKFEAFFAAHPLGDAYRKFRTPIPIRVSGSLFYDIDHAAGEVGPHTNCAIPGSGATSGCRPSTSWEIHPVTEIDFEVSPGPISQLPLLRGDPLQVHIAAAGAPVASSGRHARRSGRGGRPLEVPRTFG